MIKILSRIVGLTSVITITLGFVGTIFSQIVFAESVFQKNNEVNNVPHHLPSIAEAADAAAPALDATSALKPVPDIESEISTSKENIIDKWKLNKMCLGNFCLDDPIGKHGGFKAFKQNRQDLKLKPMALDCEGYDISLKSISQPEYYEIMVTPSPQYQEKGINNYYRITSMYVQYPKISVENVKALNDKIIKRAGGNYDGDRWVNPNNPSEQVLLHVENYWANLHIYEQTKVEKYKLLQNQTGCLSKVPDL